MGTEDAADGEDCMTHPTESTDRANEVEQVTAYLAEWCSAYSLRLDLEGEVGFGRECVGIIDGHQYVDWGQGGEPPPGVAAYHKHDCLAVLGRGDDAVIGLAAWLRAALERGCTLRRGVPKESYNDVASVFLGQRTRTVLAQHGDAQ